MNQLLGVVLASILYTPCFLHAHALAKRELILSSGTKYNCVQFEARDLSKTQQNRSNSDSNDDYLRVSGSDRPGSTDFSYAHPEKWFLDNPQCGGKRQSPVNLDTDKFVDLEVPSSLNWVGYGNQPQNLTIMDNGHTVELIGTWDKKTVRFIHGGPLGGDYLFAQLHFHWGPKNSVGSEHTVDNNSFPMELHMVHYKKDYETFEGALKHDDGLAVAAFFFEINGTSNSGINVLKDGLRKIRYKPKVKIPLKPFPLAVLHFMFLKDYASYSGSLTTPPCSEIVTWLVSLSPLTISRKLLEPFRKISNKWPGKKNYRPVQAINGRILHYVGN